MPQTFPCFMQLVLLKNKTIHKYESIWFCDEMFKAKKFKILLILVKTIENNKKVT